MNELSPAAMMMIFAVFMFILVMFITGGFSIHKGSFTLGSGK